MMFGSHDQEKKVTEGFIGAVEAGAMLNGVEDLPAFWHWLGNVKFKDWGNEITAARVSIIMNRLPALAEEFRNSLN